MDLQLNAVNWVEIPVLDFNRAKAFYSAIFNYEMPEMEMGDDKLGILLYDMPKGGIGGAIVQGPNYKPSKDGVKVYLNGGPDLNIVLNRVPEAGGKILVEKTLIAEGFGYMAGFEDTEGNHTWLHSME